jgi:excisionase family DNA binding protein
MEKKATINPVNLVTVENYAKYIGVTRQCIYNWIKEGRIKQVTFLGKSFVDKSTKR